MAHTLPPLPYAFDALEPHIDAKTMEIHHGKHHQAYVNNLNAALEKAPELQRQAARRPAREPQQVPEDIRTAVRNNGGGHSNHSMFWQIMAPERRRRAAGELAEAITKPSAASTKFKEQFDAGGRRPLRQRLGMAHRRTTAASSRSRARRTRTTR